MGFFTSAYIQTQIEYYVSQLQAASANQQHQYSGSAGNFGYQKGDMASIQKSLEFWINLGKEHYPDDFASSNSIEIWEAGIESG